MWVGVAGVGAGAPRLGSGGRPNPLWETFSRADFADFGDLGPLFLRNGSRNCSGNAGRSVCRWRVDLPKPWGFSILDCGTEVGTVPKVAEACSHIPSRPSRPRVPCMHAPPPAKNWKSTKFIFVAYWNFLLVFPHLASSLPEFSDQNRTFMKILYSTAVQWFLSTHYTTTPARRHILK